MGFFTYNYFKNIKRPEVYLAYPDKRTIGALHAYDLQTDIMANSANKGTFTVYRYEDGEETRFYEQIENGKYIHLYGVGWFRVGDVSEKETESSDACLWYGKECRRTGRWSVPGL